MQNLFHVDPKNSAICTPRSESGTVYLRDFGCSHFQHPKSERVVLLCTNLSVLRPCYYPRSLETLRNVPETTIII